MIWIIVSVILFLGIPALLEWACGILMDDAEKQKHLDSFEPKPIHFKTTGETMEVKYVEGGKLKMSPLEGSLSPERRDAIRMALVHMILASAKDPSLEKHIETLKEMMET